MIRLTQVCFALLVAITLGAFFVTQRLKQSPRLVKTLAVTREFSPRLGYVRAVVRVRLVRADEATVSILSPGGDPVRRLTHNRVVPGGGLVRLLWNGRDDRGRIVPDGDYRVRVGLRRQGRSVTLLDTITVDGTSPRPVVRVQRPAGATGPPILPQRAGAPARFVVSGATPVGSPTLLVYRTDGARPVIVRRLAAGAGQTQGSWDGRIHGRPAGAGTYLIVAKLRDRAGNVGASYPFTRPRRSDPPGGAGVTVRYVGGQAPLESVPAGARATVFVDARRAPYRWSLHRLGQARALARGAGTGPALRPPMPRAPSGVYLLELAAHGRRAAVPIAVNGAGRQRVLLVLPLLTWQALNPVDDDGDGFPDTLARGKAARVARPFAGRGEPPGFSTHESPLLRLLDRPRQRYDLQTDVAVAAASPGFLRRYRGVVLAGDERWVQPALADRLRAYVQGGGRVFSLGTRSLRRQASLAGGRIVRPSGESAFDAFGALIEPVARRRVDLLAAQDRVGLFAGTSGLFGGFDSYEATASPGTGARILAAAQVDSGRPVIVAASLGRGLVIRTGLPQWSRRLDEPDVAALTRRAWTLLSR